MMAGSYFSTFDHDWPIYDTIKRTHAHKHAHTCTHIHTHTMYTCTQTCIVHTHMFNDYIAKDNGWMQGTVSDKDSEHW